MTETPTLASLEKRINQKLEALLSHPSPLQAAMHYGCCQGGKRLRPLLCYAAALSCPVPLEICDGPALAIELIHNYSLIHDDLPAMDNDSMRRGKPSCHSYFDPATAILAGDALQAEAFLILGTHPKAGALVALLAQAIGPRGMAAGQMLDIAHTGKEASIEVIQHIHSLKTGLLIEACIAMALACVDTPCEPIKTSLHRYAKAFGLAFQIHNDLCDVAGDPATGRAAGRDLALNKNTYPSRIGLKGSQAELKNLTSQAREALDSHPGDTQHLEALLDVFLKPLKNMQL